MSIYNFTIDVTILLRKVFTIQLNPRVPTKNIHDEYILLASLMYNRHSNHEGGAAFYIACPCFLNFYQVPNFKVHYS